MARVPSAVLFACNANAVRSPMAAALFREAHGRRAFVESVGIEPGEPDPFVAVVLDEVGIAGIDAHQPKSFDDLVDGNFEVIVALTERARARAEEFTRTVHCDVLFWPTEDPQEAEGNREARLDAYRRVRDELRARILDEWPAEAPEFPEPEPEPEAAGADAETREYRPHAVKARRRGRDLWSRMRIGLRRMRR